MITVGIRELRQRASELLRLVEKGETVQITDRGRPVAVMGPLPEASPLERLRSMGEVDSASADLDELPAPLSPRHRQLPSQVLARLRQAER